MSLHKFADMVAKQGRGDDSLLIHMTPDEVRNLQKFAEANGKTLTIAPNASGDRCVQGKTPRFSTRFGI